MEWIGEELVELQRSFNDAVEYLNSIPDIYSKQMQGCYYWFIRDSRSKHIVDMVLKQKSPRHQNKNLHLKSKTWNDSDGACYFQDNINYKTKKYTPFKCS